MMFALGALLLAASAPALAGSDDATAARSAYLALEIAAARTGEPYLVLDAAAGRLTLRRQHVDLLTIAVQARAGAPRWSGRRDLAWPSARFTLDSALQEPERPRVEPPRRADGDTASAPPPTVEAIQAARDRFLAAVPVRYRLRFAPDLDVVVVGESMPPSASDRWRRAGRCLGEAWRALGDRAAGNSPRLRLLLVTDPAAARRLYLALEPGVALLVSPPASASAGNRDQGASGTGISPTAAR